MPKLQETDINVSGAPSLQVSHPCQFKIRPALFKTWLDLWNDHEGLKYKYYTN